MMVAESPNTSESAAIFLKVLPPSMVFSTKLRPAGCVARIHPFCGLVNKSSLTDVPDFRNLDKVENVLQLFPPSMDPRRTSPSLPKPRAPPVLFVFEGLDSLLNGGQSVLEN